MIQYYNNTAVVALAKVYYKQLFLHHRLYVDAFNCQTYSVSGAGPYM